MVMGLLACLSLLEEAPLVAVEPQRGQVLITEAAVQWDNLTMAMVMSLSRLLESHPGIRMLY